MCVYVCGVGCVVYVGVGGRCPTFYFKCDNDIIACLL